MYLLSSGYHGLTQQPATRTREPFTPPPQWDGEEKGQKVKLMG